MSVLNSGNIFNKGSSASLIISATTPVGVTNRFWYDTAHLTLKFYAEGQWQDIATMNPIVLTNVTNADGTNVTNADGTQVQV